MFGLKDGKFIELSTGNLFRTIKLENTSSTEEWRIKQENSSDEYIEKHQLDKIDPETKILYKLFKHFIYANISNYFNYPINILDIGCGTFIPLPPYIQKEFTENITYVGLDPYDINPERDYLFIQGVLEDLPLYLESNVKFDIFIFSTSLDHIQVIDDAADATRKIANKDAYVLFFIGLHDIETVAEMVGREHYKKIFFSLNLGAVFYQMLGTALIRMPLLFVNLKKRKNAIIKNKPLDTLHFHYFTKTNYETHIRKFGTIIEDFDIPGTNAKFICVKI